MELPGFVLAVVEVASVDVIDRDVQVLGADAVVNMDLSRRMDVLGEVRASHVGEVARHDFPAAGNMQQRLALLLDSIAVAKVLAGAELHAAEFSRSVA